MPRLRRAMESASLRCFTIIYVLDVFRKFFVDHGPAFENAPPMLSGEHNMEYYNLFQIYLKLYEVPLMTRYFIGMNNAYLNNSQRSNLT